MDNPEVLSLLDSAYQAFTNAVAAIPDEQFLSDMHGWTPRDVVAHLIGWNGLMIEASQSILAGTPPTYYADSPNDYSNINAGFVAAHASQVKSKLLADLEITMKKLMSFIAALPAEELNADHGVTRNGKPATVFHLIHSLIGDYRHHSTEITEWLMSK